MLSGTPELLATAPPTPMASNTMNSEPAVTGAGSKDSSQTFDNSNFAAPVQPPTYLSLLGSLMRETLAYAMGGVDEDLARTLLNAEAENHLRTQMKRRIQALEEALASIGPAGGLVAQDASSYSSQLQTCSGPSAACASLTGFIRRAFSYLPIVGGVMDSLNADLTSVHIEMEKKNYLKAQVEGLEQAVACARQISGRVPESPPIRANQSKRALPIEVELAQLRARKEYLISELANLASGNKEEIKHIQHTQDSSRTLRAHCKPPCSKNILEETLTMIDKILIENKKSPYAAERSRGHHFA